MTRSPSLTAVAVAALATLALAGCGTYSLNPSDKIDYRSATPAKISDIEVPPDLTQLTKDSRYQQLQTQSGSVSAAAMQSAQQAAPAAPMAAASSTVALKSVGPMRMERLGNDRWLHTSATPEQLWPQIQAFWKERGFVIKTDDAAAGIIETDWAEDRGKLPLDFIRQAIGKVFDNAFSTGTLDKFRTRLERTSDGGTDIYVTHRGMAEVYTSVQKDSTAWQPTPEDPQLEGEMLSRLMLRLGAPQDVAKTAIETPAAAAAAVAAQAPRARLLSGQPGAAMQIDDNFDRSWRRVGVALDRSGFTVEDRDRSQGVYYVRYVDPKYAGREDPNFFQKLFSFGKKDDPGLARYRVSIKADASGNSSTLSVLDNNGAPENGDAGKRITALLLDELK